MPNTVTIDKFYDVSKPLSDFQIQVLDYLGGNGPSPRRNIVSGLKSRRTTVYDNLLKLQKRKLVVKFTKNNGKCGRPLVYWRLQGD